MHECDLEQRLARAAVVAHPLQELARVPVVVDRLLVGVDRAGLIAGQDQVLGRPLGVVGLAEMAGQVGQRRPLTPSLPVSSSSARPTRRCSSFGGPR